MARERARDENDPVDLAIRVKHGLASAPARGRGRPPKRAGAPEDAELDDVDVRILRALNANARKSFRDIARELNLALSTVSSHVKKLEDSGVIRGYVPLLDAGVLGYDLVVVIGVKIAHGKLLDVQQRIARNAHVFGVYDTTGEWDSILLARFRSRSELDAFIKDLLSLPHVERTMTQLVLNTVKEERRVQV